MKSELELAKNIMGKDISAEIMNLKGRVVHYLGLKKFKLFDYGNFDSYHMNNRACNDKEFEKSFNNFINNLDFLYKIGKVSDGTILISKVNYYLLKYNFVYNKESYIKVLKFILSSGSYFKLKMDITLHELEELIWNDMMRYHLNRDEIIGILREMDCSKSVNMRFILNIINRSKDNSLEMEFFNKLFIDYKKNIMSVSSLFVKNKGDWDKDCNTVYLSYYVITKDLIKKNIHEQLIKPSSNEINSSEDKLKIMRYINEFCIIYSTHIKTSIETGIKNDITKKLDEYEGVILDYIKSNYFMRNTLLIKYVAKFYKVK